MVPLGSHTCPTCGATPSKAQRTKVVWLVLLILLCGLATASIVWMRENQSGTSPIQSSRSTPPPEPVDVAGLRAKAGQGDVPAQLALGDILIEGRKGVRIDFKEAALWFRSAADKGNAEAQNKLGMLYQAGQGVTRDDAEAARLFRRAAEQGHVGAEYNLASAYGGGRGVPQSSEESARWYLRAAEHGDSYAQFNVAQRYELGRGVTADIVEAYKWYALALKGEVEDAGKAVSRIKADLSSAQLQEAEIRIKDFNARSAGKNSKP